jgi:transmembrane sensor
VKGNISQVIDDSAARWAARTLSGDIKPEEKTALDGWLEADLRHRQAFDSYLEITELASEAHDAAAATALERELEVFAHERSSRWSWLVAAPAMAASIAAAALFFGAMTNTQPTPERYATARGETAVFTLKDGSAVSLNTDSVLEVSFSNGERSVSLARGEALFDVTRDAERPFVVSSPTAEARVLGTRFNVKATDERTIVSVLSGVVEVAAAKESVHRAAGIAVTLIAGQETVFTPDSHKKDVRTFNPDTVTSWLRGKAAYENQPLSAVIADLNRYYTAEFVLGDDSLDNIPVTGGFDLKDQAITVEALEIALSLRAEKNVAGQIVLLPNG